MWKDKLEEVKKEKEKYEELVNVGATNKQIEKFVKEVRTKFNYSLPLGYLNFLKEVNGIEFNGFIVYGIDQELLKEDVNQPINGLISFNEIWYENEEQKQYIFLGESNISWYVYGLKNNKFVELDNPSGSVVKEYYNFNSILEKILTDSLL
jgi:hypothetical protein